jgi:hypothetical protein
MKPPTPSAPSVEVTPSILSQRHTKNSPAQSRRKLSWRTPGIRIRQSTWVSRPPREPNWISQKRDKGGWTAALPLYHAEIPFLELEAREAIRDQEEEATTATALADGRTVPAAAGGGGGWEVVKKKPPNLSHLIDCLLLLHLAFVINCNTTRSYSVTVSYNPYRIDIIVQNARKSK